MTYPTISSLPTAPDRTQPSTFSTRADAFVAALATFVTETNAAGDYIDGVGTAVDADAAAAAASASDAATSEFISVAAANYKGDYDNSTTYTLGQSVSYLGSRFIAKKENTGITPVDGSDWFEIRSGKIVTSDQLTGASPTVNYNNADIFTITPTVTTTFTFTGSNSTAKFTIIVDESGGNGFGDINNAFYDSVSLDVSSEDTVPRGIAFNNDGTKMYMVGTSSEEVHQYSLSPAYDLSSASYDSVSFDVSSQDDTPYGIAFNNDGTKMYMVGGNNNSVYQYSLSSAFDLSSASYDSVSLDVSSEDTDPNGIAFNNDGTKLYMFGASSDEVHQYSLSPAYDLSSASYDSVSFDVSSEDTSPTGIAFNNDGTKLYMVGNSNDSVYQYSLSSAFDLSSASYDFVYLDVSSQDVSPQGIAFNNDGTKMYMVGTVGGSIYQYSTKIIQTLIFPSSVEFPEESLVQRPSNTKTAFDFVTTDTGTSYQCVNITKGIS